MLEFFDTHAHYMDEAFDEDRDILIPSLYEKYNVKYIVNIGYDMWSSKRATELADKYSFCYSAVGIHPHDAKNVKPGDYDELIELSKNKKNVAIGEIGLDYFYENSEREIQKKVFAEQMDISYDLKLPISIHSREATKDTLDIISSKENVGVFHCFSGSVETAKIILNKGYFISFAGPVTFKNASNLKEVAKYVPEDRFFIETDSPYLSPVPLRGQRNDSKNLFHIARVIGDIKGKSAEDIAEMTLLNAKKFFNIKG